VIDADLEDYGLAPAFLMGLDLRALCKEEETRIVHGFLAEMNEEHPAWMAFVPARGVGDHVEEDARKQLDTFRRGFEADREPRAHSACRRPDDHVDLTKRTVDQTVTEAVLARTFAPANETTNITVSQTMLRVYIEQLLADEACKVKIFEHAEIVDHRPTDSERP
jgi:hypothetical protein